jgi:hypothetical protein
MTIKLSEWLFAGPTVQKAQTSGLKFGGNTREKEFDVQTNCAATLQ